jgi:hypothetical protein
MIYTTSANLSNPSISLTGGAGKWSIYFGAWANDDSGSVAEFSDGTNTYNAVAYGSVWKTTTLNGGSTWTDADMVVGNAPDISQDQKLDFHFPSTSTFNPASSSSTDEYLVFAADTCGGLHQEGYVGFSDVHYLMKKVTVNAVRKDGQPNSVITNYPNPVISGNATTITFSLQNASDVNLVVTDVLGRTVAQLSEGKLSGGAHEISFTTKNLSPGVYNYSIRAGSETAYGAMNVIR